MATHLSFVGLGTMGSAMVRRLVQHGYTVHTWSRNPDRYSNLANLPLVRHNSLSELAKANSVICLNVTSTKDVEQLLFSEQGIAYHAPKNTLVIDFSTIDSSAAKEFAKKLSQTHQIDYLDSPVSGGGAGAQQGSLSIMVGGEQFAFQRAKPIFEILGKTCLHVGESGAGQAIKAANQMAMCIQLAGLSEAFAYARAQGAKTEVILEMLSAGLAGSKVLDWVGPHWVKQFDMPPTIEARLHQKDLSMIANAADKKTLHLPMLKHTAKLLESLVEEGGAHKDTSEVFKLVERAMKRPL